MWTYMNMAKKEDLNIKNIRHTKVSVLRSELDIKYFKVNKWNKCCPNVKRMMIDDTRM